MKVLRLFLVFILLCVALEVTLRLVWGFGTPALYTASRTYEYMYSPNQSIHRYGNDLKTNSFGMRSEEPSSHDSIRVLYLGDSVINGGMQTDQDELSSSLLAKKLSAILKKPVNILNISAGSWGPDNAAAFLKANGTFNAQAMVVLFSSHDAYDNMDFEPIVNENVNYPAQNPQSAISEVFLRYMMPAFGSIFGMQKYTSNKLMINEQRKVFNKGWNELIQLAGHDSIPLIVVLHAEQEELEHGRFNRYGREIMDTLTAHKVVFYTDLNWGITKDCYRDFIHPNAKGQKFLADHLTDPILKALEKAESH